MSADEHLRIEVRHEPDRVVVSLHGELDLLSAPLLTERIESPEIAAASTVVLDLKDLSFMDSTGLRVILTAHQRSSERGADLALTRGCPQVRRLLSLTRVGKHLRVIDSPRQTLV